MLLNSGGRAGLEPTEVWSKNLAERVLEVLKNFKNRIEDATQVEKCLLFRRTIEKVRFGMESVEVVICLEDAAGDYNLCNESFWHGVP